MTSGWFVSNGMCGDVYDVIADNKASVLFQFGGLKSDTTFSGLCGTGSCSSGTTPWGSCAPFVSLCTGMCAPNSTDIGPYLSTPAAYDDGSFIYIYRQFRFRDFYRCVRPASTVKLSIRGSWNAGTCSAKPADSYFGFAATYYDNSLVSSGGVALSTINATLTNRQHDCVNSGITFCGAWGLAPGLTLEIDTDGNIINASALSDNVSVPVC